jgi:hypothetical protein
LEGVGVVVVAVVVVETVFAIEVGVVVELVIVFGKIVLILYCLVYLRLNLV